MASRAPRLLSVVLALLATFALGGTGTGQETDGNRWAIVCGLNDYMKDVTPLRCAVTDAGEVRKALVEVAGFDPRRVVMLSTDQRENHIPTKVNIVRWISEMKDSMAPGDTFFFFFSGHGVQMDEEGYLLTFEADPFSEDTLDASSLRLSDLRKYLKKMKAARILLFTDACRDDPRSASGGVAVGSGGNGSGNLMTEGFSNGLTFEVGAGGEDRLVGTYFSCDLGERSWEWSGHSMGFFSYFLVRGLRGGAQDQTGAVTPASLGEFLAATVPEAVWKERKEKQTPRTFLHGQKSSDFALSRSPGPLAWTPPGPLGQPGAGARSVQGIPRARLRYTLDIVANTVEGRHYDDLTHEIVENVFEPDREALRAGAVRLLDGTGRLEATTDGDEADLWVFLNVCPTREMSVDLMVRDPRVGSFICKKNLRLRRPHPGRQGQLTEVALKALEERFLADLLDQISP